MADKRLDQVTKVTDMAYVPVIMSDGSIGQIAKADLASIVGELTQGKYESSGCLMKGSNITDADTVHTDYSLKAGVYSFTVGYNVTANLPLNTNGVLIHEQRGNYSSVFSSSLIRQTFFSATQTYIRYGKGDGSSIVYGDWQLITNFGYNTLAELSAGVASNNPRTITSLRGKRLYKIGKASTWDYGSFIASVSDATGKGCSLIGISFRNMNTTQNVTYTRTGDSTLGVQVYKRIVEGTMEVFIYSSNNADSFSPMCGFSSQSVELIGEITDLTDYTLVVSW